MIIKSGYLVKATSRSGVVQYISPRNGVFFETKKSAEREANFQRKNGYKTEVVISKVCIDPRC